jgi:acetylglutamate/LysW-gamma-L-alpha-aminoadipate kinase
MLVIKIGGSVRNLDGLLLDVASVRERLVLVHGASRELDALSVALGKPPRIVESVRGEVSRFTDCDTMDRFLMAYAGKVNKRIVERLRQLSVNAIGLTGLDGGLVRGRRRRDLRIRDGDRIKVLHDNHVGSIEHVDAELLRALLDRGLVPVLTPPIAAEDGTAINVDGDRLAAEIAVALRASTLLILSDTPGLLRDANDDTTLIERLESGELEAAVELLGGRARTKLRAAAGARRRGVTAVGIADGRVERPVVTALAGSGTWLS